MKVRLLVPPNAAEAEALVALLAEAGCEIEDSGDARADGPALADDAGPGACPAPLIVLLPDDDAPDAAFDRALFEAARDGCKVVGVWPRGGGGTCPQAFDDYGGDTVPWKPAALAGAVDGTAQHLDGDDRDAEEPETERHECK